MAKVFMPDASPDERMRVLQNNADKIEETTYERELTSEELDIKRETFFNNHRELNKLEEDLADIKSGFKTKIDPLKVDNKKLLRQVSTGKEEVNGILFHMANHEDGYMETYDQSGELVASRRLRPDEKRQTIPFIPKAVAGE